MIFQMKIPNKLSWDYDNYFLKFFPAKKYVAYLLILPNQLVALGII